MLELPEQIKSELANLLGLVQAFYTQLTKGKKVTGYEKIGEIGTRQTYPVYYGSPKFAKSLNIPSHAPALASPGYEELPFGIWLFTSLLSLPLPMIKKMLAHELTHLHDPKTQMDKYKYWKPGDELPRDPESMKYINEPTEQDANSSSIGEIVQFAKDNPQKIPAILNNIRQGNFAGIRGTDSSSPFWRNDQDPSWGYDKQMWNFYSPENKKRHLIRIYNALADAGLV
jgi:hypothetical protein